MQGIDGVFRPAQVVRTEVDHHAQRGDDDAKDAGPERTHQHCVTRGRDDQADENVHQSPSAHIELEQLPLRDHVELVRRQGDDTLHGIHTPARMSTTAAAVVTPTATASRWAAVLLDSRAAMTVSPHWRSSGGPTLSWSRLGRLILSE